MSNSKQVIEWRRRTKKNVLDGFDNKCAICGYNKCVAALEFHHINPDEKEFSFSSFQSLKWEKIVSEMQKCICVCANCHREIHAGMIELSESVTRFDPDKITYKKYDTLRKKR